MTPPFHRIHINRREFVLASAASTIALGTPRFAFAQQSQTKQKRVGIIVHLPEDDPNAKKDVDYLWGGIAKTGWSEKDLLVDYRWNVFSNDLALQPANELVALKPDVLFTRGTPGVVALAALTKTIPIVFTFVNGETLSKTYGIQDFAHPNRNMTGFVNVENFEVQRKSIDLLKEMMPGVARMAVLYGPDSVPGGEAVFLSSYSGMASQAGLQFLPYPLTKPSDISAAIQNIASDPTAGVIVSGDGFMQVSRSVAIAEVARQHLVAVWQQQVFATDGGIAAYSGDVAYGWGGAGNYVGLVLNGAKPADLPIQPVPLVLTVNLKAAKELGFAIPAGVVARADAVIQ